MKPERIYRADDLQPTIGQAIKMQYHAAKLRWCVHKLEALQKVVLQTKVKIAQLLFEASTPDVLDCRHCGANFFLEQVEFGASIRKTWWICASCEKKNPYKHEVLGD